jgi:proteasome lid subunit RPN8/RPN11
MQPVIIEKPCFFTIAASCMEVYNRETTGFLLGKDRYRKINKRQTKVAVLEAAYPLQTARRKPTEVEPGNRRAYKRAEAAIKSMEYDIKGEYHSHIGGDATLSKDDIEYVEERDKWLKSHDLWSENIKLLELVVMISRRRYENPHKIGWTFHDYAKKAGVVFVLDEYVGYNITFGAYWLERRKDRLRPIETEVFIPWWKGYWSE